jgi:lysophospholipase L1-like esterase
MRLRGIVLGVCLVLWGEGAVFAAPPPYDLALGDSLAIGLQPTLQGGYVPTNVGYVDDLYRLLRLHRPDLRLAKLGCPGETTGTMRDGGLCYAVGASQLDTAIAFIHTHRVALVTVDIGGDNVYGCFGLNGVDETCFDNGLAAVQSDLPEILHALKEAAGPGVPVVAMNYYDPFLAAWRLGPAGKLLAWKSLWLASLFNDAIADACRSEHVRLADVAAAFRIDDWNLVPIFWVPKNVLLELAWTWIGALPPAGPDIHPNTIGYGVIAGAFARALGLL